MKLRSLHIKILFTALAMFILPACDNYLSENPDNRVELNTLDKCAKLLTNAYSDAAYTFTEWMGDNVSYTTGTTKLPEHNEMYQWQDPISVNQDTPTNFWQETYQSIAHANEVLAVIDNIDGDHLLRNAIKAEAYLTRAYGHFMLVNLFAKQYDSQTASTDPGIPYVLEPETVFIKKYDRNTVAEVYKLTESDIKNGLKYVNDGFYANSGKYHFTVNAALAFATRFYLFKGDYDNCIRYSTQMLGSDPSTFIKNLPDLLAKTLPDNFSSEYSSPKEASNLILVRQVTNFPVNVGFWPNAALRDEIFVNNPFGAVGDFRNQANTVVFPQYLRGSGVSSGASSQFFAFAKYQFLFQRTSLTSNVGLNYTIMPVFRGEEVLLSRAEAYIMQNQMSLALADLQVLIAKRYEGNPTVTTTALRSYYSGATSSQQAALYFVIDERRKEFIQEGLRWYDIKRFHMPVTHLLSNNLPITLVEDDPRKILQIPQAAIDIGGLKANPR